MVWCSFRTISLACSSALALACSGCAVLTPLLHAGAVAVVESVDWNRLARCAALREHEHAACLGMAQTQQTERIADRGVATPAERDARSDPDLPAALARTG